MYQVRIDPDAKGKVDLVKQLDSNDQPYYIGKLQLPVTMHFDRGVSFMVFISEEGVEELQIAPLDPSRRSKGKRDGAGLSGGRLSVDLHPMKDQNDNLYYIGEAIGPIDMKLDNGIFFTVFTSRPGEEELQISKLNHKKTPYKPNVKNIEIERVESPRQYKRGWPPRVEESVS